MRADWLLPPRISRKGGAKAAPRLLIGHSLIYGKWHFTEIDIDRTPLALKQSTTLVPSRSGFLIPPPPPPLHLSGYLREVVVSRSRRRPKVYQGEDILR